jgi:excisionase family DNA binding protein
METQNTIQSGRAAGKKPHRSGGRWSIQRVAEFLSVSDDKARQWIKDHKIPEHDIGKGSRALIRVERKAVLAAYHGSRIERQENPEQQQRPIGYVPKYFKPRV